MRQNYWLLLLFLLLAGNIFARDYFGDDSTKIKKKKAQFFSLNTMGGWVFPTNDFVSGINKIPGYASFALKYGISSDGNDWQDLIYGMPYYGMGLYTAKFFDKKGLGQPVSLYVFQGATIKSFTPRLSLNYEWNLGMSFNWKPYDVFDNPENIALSTSTNVHVSVNAYLKWYLSPAIDLHFGLSATHFSNGAARLPNAGINLVAPFVEVVYNFNRRPPDQPEKLLTPPPVKKRIDYDILFTASSRQIRFDTLGTGLPSRFIDKNFKVFGLSYAAMFINSHKYKWGPSLELVYDESSGVSAWREQHPEDGKFYDRVKLGDIYKRFTVGLSLKGELTLSRLSLFMNVGYNILHGNEIDYRLYQIIGAKVCLKENVFATFGIRASRFSKAQYLFWSIGYTIEGKPFRKKERFIDHILP